MVDRVEVRKEVLVSTGQYENVRLAYAISRDVGADQTAAAVAATVTVEVNAYLRQEVDAIEFGKRKIDSKAGRFGI